MTALTHGAPTERRRLKEVMEFLLFSQSPNTGRVAKTVDAVAWRRLRVISLDLRETLPFVFSLFSHPLESCHFGDGFLSIIGFV